jgi:hypothetical protein
VVVVFPTPVPLASASAPGLSIRMFILMNIEEVVGEVDFMEPAR